MDINKQWVTGVINSLDTDNTFYTNASTKFVDTGIGGHIVCNPKPQFCRYGDPRNKGRVHSRNDVSPTDTSGNYGMGEFYSKAFDDNSEKLFIEAGVPEFNSLFSFYTRAIDINTATVVAEGRSPIMSELGYVWEL